MAYDYPKSSCPCYTCDVNPVATNLDSFPSGRAVPNCCTPINLECTNTMAIDTVIEPNIQYGYDYLNPQLAQKSFATDFKKTQCRSGTVYFSTDPRLIDPRRGQMIALDRPPYDTDVKLDTIYSNSNHGCGVYPNYQGVNRGQILYYTDREQKGSYFTPNFTISTNVDRTLFKDPMGSIKPHYARIPIKDNNPMDVDRKSYNGQLSWISDSLEQRENIMASQMAVRNQSRYQSRY